MKSNEYTLDPSTISFDDRYVIFNPIHNQLEYDATKESIKRLGQLDPILMLDDKCIDGRHRVKIANELGIYVRCVNIEKTLSDEDIIVMCNKNVMSGRDYDNSQKAIQALSLVNSYNMKAVDAAKLMKIDKRMVSYAATIKGYGRQDILDTLLSDKSSRVQLTNMERPSRSLELLAKFVKTEEESYKVVVDDSERVQWKPDAAIKTEAGKAWYYETIDAIKELGEIKMHMVLTEMANMKFKLKEEQ